MELLNSSIAHDVIFEGLSLGADFVDLFIERTQTDSILFKSQKTEDKQSGIIFGIGIRLIAHNQAYYGYTNQTDREELLRITRLLGAQIGRRFNPAPINFEKLNYPPVASLPDRDVPVAHKLAKLASIDQRLRQDDKVSQVILNYLYRHQEIEIYNSDNMYAHENRPYVRLAHQVVMKDGNLSSDAFYGPGARGGWEFIEKMPSEKICEDILKQAKTTLYADMCPAGKMPVVIDKGFGGVIFHEACGHLLETTSVEKKASVFWDKMGESIAHSALSAVDDGTIGSEWGSLAIDDEGMPSQRTTLIEKGVLKNFIADRLGEMKTGHKRTGSARRQSYKFAPASRMRNTFIERGPHSLDELIANAGNGLYAKSMGGGSVNPGTGEFNFAVQEAYLIENGKITKPVKGATLIGTGPEVMQKISMIGKELELMAGMCGSVSGSIPTTVGQPPIKVDEILVGGRA
jgi:TldD protein